MTQATENWFCVTTSMQPTPPPEIPNFEKLKNSTSILRLFCMRACTAGEKVLKDRKYIRQGKKVTAEEREREGISSRRGITVKRAPQEKSYCIRESPYCRSRVSASGDSQQSLPGIGRCCLPAVSRVMLWLFVIDVIWLLLLVMVVSRLYAKHLGTQSRGWVKQGTLGRA